MCLEKLSPFTRMILGALLGVVLGIIFGLLFGLLISWITSLVVAIFPHKISNDSADFVPYNIASFLGMGAGGIIGAILGAVYANKKK